MKGTAPNSGSHPSLASILPPPHINNLAKGIDMEKPHPMEREPALIRRSDWAREEDQWVGRFEGGDVGTNVTVLLFF